MSAHEAAFEYHHRRWWIFKAVFWYAAPPWAATCDARAFNTFQEAVDYFAANVLPIAEGAGE